MRSNREVASRALPRTGAEELAAGSALLAGAESGEVDLERSAKAESAAGAVVEESGDLVALLLGESGEVGAFGEILAEETVGVFVGAALPGVVRGGEVEASVQAARDVLEAVEFGAVVGSEGEDGVGLVVEEGDNPAGGGSGSRAGKLADANEAAFAFDGGGDAGLAAAMDSVEFPVADASAAVHDGGALVDHGLTSEAATAVVAPIAFAPAFLRAAQVLPERAARRPVPPDMEVDGFMAHDRKFLQAPPAHDLLRTPVLPQQGLDGRKLRGAIPGVAPRAAPPPVGHLDRHRGSVGPVMRGGVTLQFTTDRCWDGVRVPPRSPAPGSPAGAGSQSCIFLPWLVGGKPSPTYGALT